MIAPTRPPEEPAQETVAAYYEPLGGDRFRATHWASGPWDAASLHGGPPSALLARSIEHCSGDIERPVVTRIAVDLLGPIPLGDADVHAEVLRPGRRVELVEARMSVADRPVAIARAWRVARGDTAALRTPEPARPPRPDTATAINGGWPGGYLDSIEWRFLPGGGLGEPGPATVWGRARVPLVLGEAATPLQRLLTIADSGSGVSSVLDPTRYLFINTELTVHLVREPEGEWVCLDARTTIGPRGGGLALTHLSDDAGRLGVATQALLVTTR